MLFRSLNLSYRTVHRWLREFRAEGMPGLFPAPAYPREPPTPESVIIQLRYFKCCLPAASDHELARVISPLTERRLHHETVEALLARCPVWRYPGFQRPIRYQVPRNAPQRRLEMVKLKVQGWTEKRIAQLLCGVRNTVMKWLWRARQAAAEPDFILRWSQWGATRLAQAFPATHFIGKEKARAQGLGGRGGDSFF